MLRKEANAIRRDRDIEELEEVIKVNWSYGFNINLLYQLIVSFIYYCVPKS